MQAGDLQALTPSARQSTTQMLALARPQAQDQSPPLAQDDNTALSVSSFEASRPATTEVSQAAAEGAAEPSQVPSAATSSVSQRRSADRFALTL